MKVKNVKQKMSKSIKGKNLINGDNDKEKLYHQNTEIKKML